MAQPTPLDYNNDWIDDIGAKLSSQANADNTLPDVVRKDYIRNNVSEALEKHNNFIVDQLRQYENVTQYLTYAKQLDVTQNYLASMLSKERTVSEKMDKKIRTDLYKVRERYIMKQNKYDMRNSRIFLIKITILFLVYVVSVAMLFLQKALSSGMMYALIGVGCVVYFLFLIWYVNDTSKRNRSHWRKYDFNAGKVKSTSSSSNNSCAIIK